MILYLLLWKSVVRGDDRPLGIITLLLRLKSCHKPKATQTEMKADTVDVGSWSGVPDFPFT